MTLPADSEFADLDRHFARFIAAYGDGELPATAAALLSRNLRQGHICLDLRTALQLDGFRWPSLPAWRKALGANRAIGGPGDDRPIVLDSTGRLYLRRYWEYETALAAQILSRCGGEPIATKSTGQQRAIETALARRFTVISGGPGTGKTTTVLKIIECLKAAPGGEKLRIALAAPTGKAAARLQETAKMEASTLHRLLGARGESIQFRHNAGNPLPLDVLVLDEASMVPLTMMAKLFDALPAAARVILLGDRDQLASVEPGAVLGDIAEAASHSGSPLHDSMVVLRENFRFGNKSAIYRLCNAVREGHADAAFKILASGAIPTQPVPAPGRLIETMRDRILAGYSACLRAGDPAEALRLFREFRILCALRGGPFGVENLNRRIAALLREEGLDRALPVLITRNDYPLRLFNGDIGMIVDGAAWFAGEDGALRHIPPARLPEHEPAFAMTVHKSQGSEFENVLLLLPDKESPVLTRELVYTGLTRARREVELWYEPMALGSAITARTTRNTGLADALTSGQSGSKS
ncbi:MAG TPA: exodeoxyribonuclease V subunit alpha [Chthoniobacteraceae bacterium]|jgi:exodeoxyribonuclease V alpha subunit|nr:exodeoxyribonuclease V subunit alpha [Chthoniobacteraceae bacterium]